MLRDRLEIPVFVGAVAATISCIVRAEPRWLYPLVVGAGVASITFQIGKALRARRVGMRAELSADDAKAAYQALRDIAHKSGDDSNVETATLVLDSEKASFERTSTGSDNLEAKATTVLGIVAGASSAFGLFGIAKSGNAIVATPLLFTAFMFILVSFVALLYMLRAKTIITPDLRVYLTPAIAREDNRVGLALSLAARYNEMRHELRREIAAEPHALFVAYSSIATAAMLVVLNTIASSRAAPPKPAVTSPHVSKPPRPVQSRATRRQPSTSIDGSQKQTGQS
jgi:hypothetical protein